MTVPYLNSVQVAGVRVHEVGPPQHRTVHLYATWDVPDTVLHDARLKAHQAALSVEHRHCAIDSLTAAASEALVEQIVVYER